MAGCTFEDALTGATIAFDRETGGVGVEEADTGPVPCRSLFFPGCSMITYALPLVEAVHATLREAGEVDGASLLCCGKILEYEPHGKELRASFEGDLVGLVAATGAERIVAACPNCVRALREALERYPWRRLPRMQGIFAWLMRERRVGALLALARLKRRFLDKRRQ